MTKKYKLVREEQGELVSLNTCGTNVHKVVYEPMKWAIAPIGGLLVFAEEEAAHSFMLEMGTKQNGGYSRYEYQLWRCDCCIELELPTYRFNALLERPDGLTLAVGEADPIIESTFRKVWTKDSAWDMETLRGFHRNVNLMTWPIGTEAWKHVRLVSQVEEKYHIITAA